MTPPLTGNGNSVDAEVPGWAIRLEAKIDVALAQHSANIESVDRDVKNVQADVKAIDTRVDVLERSNFVTSKGLAAALITTLTGVGGFIAVVDRLMSVQ